MNFYENRNRTAHAIIKACISEQDVEHAQRLQQKLLMQETQNTGSLYRYRPANKYTLQELQTGKMYCSKPSEFNDSFDSKFGIGFKALGKAILLGVINNKIPNPNKHISKEVGIQNAKMLLDTINSSDELAEEPFFKFLDDYAEKLNTPSLKMDVQKLKDMLKYFYTTINKTIEDSYYLGCFSVTPFSQLMWAYYAQSEKGVCLEYDFSQQVNSDKNSFLPIIYSSKRPTIPWDAVITHGTSSIPAAEKIIEGLITKGQSWSHEKEWRVIIPQSQGQYYDLPPIKCIYLGHKMKDEQYKKEICQIAKTKNIPVKQLCISSDTYMLYAKEINI